MEYVHHDYVVPTNSCDRMYFLLLTKWERPLLGLEEEEMLPKLTPYSQPSSGLTLAIEASIFQLAPSTHRQPGEMYDREAASRLGQLTEPSSVEKAPLSALASG